MTPLRILGKQLTRFGLVGAIATGLHVLVATGMHDLWGMSPLLANMAGFVAAFLFSYLGHYHWTFTSVVSHGTSFPRFLLVSVSAFFVSQVIVWAGTHVFAMPMKLAMVPVAVFVPLSSFVVNRIWTFTAKLNHETNEYRNDYTAS